MPTMALYASIGRVNTSFPVWTEPFKLNNQGVRFPGSRGVRVVYRLERVLSTKSSLLPWLVTRLLPGRVAIALLKVIQSASSVSHDLQHITFLSTKIMKSFSFPSLSSLPHIALVHSLSACVTSDHVSLATQTDWDVGHGCVMCGLQAMKGKRGGAVLAAGSLGLMTIIASLRIFLWARVTEDHHH